jgi:hypothetical protein
MKYPKEFERQKFTTNGMDPGSSLYSRNKAQESWCETRTDYTLNRAADRTVYRDGRIYVQPFRTSSRWYKI